MNDTKFTPGPWYNATKKDSFQGLIYSEVTGENIAITYNPNNAALVAAAPDLLEACILAQELICGLLYHIDAENKIVLPALDAAIIKAQGES